MTRYVRTDPYRRTASIEFTEQGAGAAGAFSVLLQVNPGLQDWITQAVSKKRVAIEQVSTDNGLKTRLRNLKPLHLDFLKQCRALGLSGTDYPFNTERMGIRSLAVAVRAECLRDFDRGARLAGAKHINGMPRDAAATATAPLEVVEFDGHRLDIRPQYALGLNQGHSLRHAHAPSQRRHALQPSVDDAKQSARSGVGALFLYL